MVAGRIAVAGTVADAADLANFARELGDDLPHATDSHRFAAGPGGRNRWRGKGTVSTAVGHAALEVGWARAEVRHSAGAALVSPFAAAARPAVGLRAALDVLRVVGTLVTHEFAAGLGAVLGGDADPRSVVRASAATVDA